MKIDNIINHIVLVLDASTSMTHLSNELIKVADNQIAHLASRSQEMDQETRITVYTFASGGVNWRTPKIDCLVYDKDVLRMPSISQVYKAEGNTPLIDATIVALDDLAQTPEKYGDHSFLIYVLTDGQENISRHGSEHLRRKIAELPDHWTIAAFVPDQYGVHEAKRHGFPAQNIAVWDATTVRGLEEAGLRIRETTETFMSARAHAKKTGTTFRGTRSLFTLKDPSLSQISRSLTPLQTRDFQLLPVIHKSRIDEFVQAHGHSYQVGKAFYELSKRETIQPQKQIAIMSNRDGMVYTGTQARDLLGLPHNHITVGPNDNPDYKVFVQSTSVNRNLMPDTDLLLLS